MGSGKRNYFVSQVEPNGTKLNIENSLVLGITSAGVTSTSYLVSALQLNLTINLSAKKQ